MPWAPPGMLFVTIYGRLPGTDAPFNLGEEHIMPLQALDLAVPQPLSEDAALHRPERVIVCYQYLGTAHTVTTLPL